MALEISVQPGGLKGEVTAPASKSAVHRALICAALADGVTRLRLSSISADIFATMACLTALGAGLEREGEDILITPIPGRLRAARFPCGESGSTLRFLLPLAGVLLDEAVFSGSGSLPKRPIAGLQRALAEHGAVFSDEKLPFKVSGRLEPGRYTIAGDVSSQYLSGLLFALPLLEGDSEIVLTSSLLSAPYVDMTVEMLFRFGVQVQKTEQGYWISGNQRYRTPGVVEPEGDWSLSAAFLVAGALGGDVTVSGLKRDTRQGDRGVLELLASCGAGIEVSEERVRVFRQDLKPFFIDVCQIPDLLPILAVLAGGANGKSRLYNAARLKLKESDRLLSTEAMLTALGGRARAAEDSLEIEGGPFTGGWAKASNDHRIAMAAAIAATVCSGETHIEGAEAVEKSYPGFFRDFQRLGGKMTEKEGRSLEA